MPEGVARGVAGGVYVVISGCGGVTDPAEDVAHNIFVINSSNILAISL